MEIKYPNITVRLIGEDGNAFAILGRVKTALRRHDVPPQEVEAFMAEATAGNYDHLLQITMRTVNVK